MKHQADIVIRGGTVVDGSGGAPFVADVALIGDRIAAIGPDLDWAADAEINARKCIVTPGFVDVHSHYDGQSIWSNRLSPSSSHGVTTVAMGNCGVGFAPCRQEDRERLVSVMEGVEDIPEIVMTRGLPWNWETFGDFLNAIEAGRRDIDVAAYIPHAALRVYVMGQRGAAREAATQDDLAQMAAIVEEGMRAGALGFATASVPVHRTSAGDLTPTFGAAEEELQAIAAAIRRAGRGVMQILVDFSEGSLEHRVGLLERLSATSGAVVTFTLVQTDNRPTAWREVLYLVEQANRKSGVSLKAQIFPRPIGMLLGHDVSLNPFRLCASYDAIANLNLTERIAELGKPEMRVRLLAEVPSDPKMPLFVMARNFERIFSLGTPPVYEPALEDSIASRARRAGVTPESLAYDMLLEDGGNALLLSALANYADGSLDATYEMLAHPDCVPGLGDGGAHYGLICDASFTTYMLTHWTRDRVGRRLGLPQAVAALTRRPAELLGLLDRGVVATGAKADINVIDYDKLTLLSPYVKYDLPAGGRRIDQRAQGYVATIVSGQIIAANDVPTGATPGRVIRAFGRQIAA